MDNRIKELDGLRGVAILLVVAFHLFWWAEHFTEHAILEFITGLTSIGWAGVDIFFTLSGFLITSILLNSKNKEGYFKNFYARRVLRIFPLYYFSIGVVLLFAPNLEPEFIQNLKYALPVMFLYLQNWFLIYDNFFITDYLGVTWSLAIEEQFYFIWPLLVKWLNREKLIKFSLIYIALLLIIQFTTVLLWNDQAEITLFYYLSSFTRFEEMLFGGLLAIWMTYDGALEKIRRLSMPVIFVSLLAFIFICLASLPSPLQPVNNIPLTLGGYTSLGLLVAGLIGVFITYPPENILRRVFQNQALIFFGKYSYSMYLFHEVVGRILFDELWNRGYHGWGIFFIYLILAMGITIIVAWLTWHLLEKHMLGLKKYFEYKNSLKSTR